MREDDILSKIVFLSAELERVKATPIPTQKYDEYEETIWDSDGIPRKIKKYGPIPLSASERREYELEKEKKIRGIESEISELRGEYAIIQSEKSLNISKPEEEKEVEIQNEQGSKITEEEHNKEFTDLDDLILALKRADMGDLARNLSSMRYANRKMNDTYMQDEVEKLKTDHERISKRETTAKEYKEIKDRVKSIGAKATANAKKYKELYRLFKNASKVMEIIRSKGIEYDVDELKQFFLEHYRFYFYWDPFSEYAADYQRKPYEVFSKSDQEERLEKEKEERNKEYSDLDKLIGYIKQANSDTDTRGLQRLAIDLYNMRYAYQKMNDTYMQGEVNYQVKKELLSTNKTTMTQKEYKQVKKRVKSIGEKATETAKRYKSVYGIFLNASSIVKQIENLPGHQYPHVLYEFFKKNYRFKHFFDYNSNYNQGKKEEYRSWWTTSTFKTR